MEIFENRIIEKKLREPEKDLRTVKGTRSPSSGNNLDFSIATIDELDGGISTGDHPLQ